MERVVNRTDLIENVRNHSARRTIHFIKSEYDVNVVRKILSLYIWYMTRALFTGVSWWLPGGFGRIKIVKKTYDTPQKIPFFKKHLKNKDAINRRVYNPKTPGLVFTIEMESEFLKKHKCRFKAAKSIRRELFDKLYNDNFANEIK